MWFWHPTDVKIFWQLQTEMPPLAEPRTEGAAHMYFGGRGEQGPVAPIQKYLAVVELFVLHEGISVNNDEISSSNLCTVWSCIAHGYGNGVLEAVAVISAWHAASPLGVSAWGRCRCSASGRGAPPREQPGCGSRAAAGAFCWICPAETGKISVVWGLVIRQWAEW